MKKNKLILVSILSMFSFSAFASSKGMKTCEDFGMETEVLQLEISTQNGFLRVGEAKEFCTLLENDMISTILASSILSENPNFAATAYRTGPKPNIKSGGGDEEKLRLDHSYCKSLGGTYQLGAKVVGGGWINIDDPSRGQKGMCVFADGSMIATWTLFYKRLEPSNSRRPELENFFQNDVIPGKSW